MKWLVSTLLVVIVILVVAVAYLAGKQNISFLPQSSPSPVATSIPQNSNSPVACTMEAKLCPDGSSVGRVPPDCEFAACPEVKTKKVTGGGVLSFPRYELTVPADWAEKRESYTKDDEKLTLSKGNLSFSILQGGFGGGICVYPGEPDPEGPGSRYTSFVEITNASGDLFRRGTPQTGTGYGICQKTQYGWESPTLYGGIGIKVPSPTDLPAIDSILASLKKI